MVNCIQRNLDFLVQILFMRAGARIIMKLLIGKKLSMANIYDDNGNVVPVTEVKVGKGTIVQVKYEKKDGYKAVQLGFEEGSKNVNQAISGHVKKLVKNPLLREVRVENTNKFQAGQEYDASILEKGEKVTISGISKGRGFQGVVKRHGFHGSDKTHGTKHHLRAPGSIGATDPERVFPGVKMAGRMGGYRATVKNLEIADIDFDRGVVKIKGAVPGARGGLVEILAEGEIKPVQSENKEQQSENKNEDKKSSQEDKK